MVAENDNHRNPLKLESVGPEMHQNALKKISHDPYTCGIVLQCYICCYEVLCLRSGQDTIECESALQRHVKVQVPLQ